MKKRLFAIMLALAMALVMVPALAEEGEVEEQNQVQEKILCATERCANEVTNKGDFCEVCAAKKAEEEAAKKAAEEEAAKKAAEEEAAKKAAEEPENTQTLLGETNPAGTGTANGCNHEHTTGWSGTMVEHPAVAATCITEGNVKYYTCNNCGGYFLRNEKITNKIDATPSSAEEVKIAKTSHELVQIAAKAATCTEAGNIEYYECSDCKGKFADANGTQPVENIVIPALGHAIPADCDYTVKPTCTTAGKATYKCSKCNTKLEDVEIPALGHSYGAPVWSWYGFTSARATFVCTRNCGHSETKTASIVRSRINSCGYYTYTATVKFNGKTYTDTKTDYSCRPGWYYDDCYYRNTCGHWGCGDVCTRYSDCIPCRNYRTAFRTGGYNCLATPKTGDASVMAPAILALIGAAGAMLGKKRR